MIGKYNIILRSNKVVYNIEVKRNITIISGDSGIGKSVFANMVSQYNNFGSDSGIYLESDVDVMSIDNKFMINEITSRKNTIFVIDENVSFIYSSDFAKIVKNSDNYFILITREDLCNLPYSYKEIYTIKNSGKFNTLKRLYPDFETLNDTEIYEVWEVFTEDSNSGFEFFSNYFNNKKVSSLGGKSFLKDILYTKLTNSLIIVDGAAFGSEIREIYSIMNKFSLKLFAPESFEFMLLRSNIFKNLIKKDILENTFNYVDSSKYFSWEIFFTHILIEISKDTPFRYKKSHINENYINNDKIMSSIVSNFIERKIFTNPLNWGG